ncbi:hypothetical protein FW784_10030 [Lysobacter lacus]|uniref:Uncharacterized protein n=2 Tax=Cognatilysobacter lacus TaxID=1643323 RepID=A0A5D8Z110_9GAMM|nr:hypothetical protein FW784_10030 [Lysobacter lacus]
MTFFDREKPLGEGWHWSGSDFLVMGALLFSAGLAYQLIARKLSTSTARAAFAFGIVLLVVGIWVELAVGGVSQIAAWLAR